MNSIIGDLNGLPAFRDKNPSSEHIAMYIFEIYKDGSSMTDITCIASP